MDSHPVGTGMRGRPSVRLHYAYQFPQPDGSRIVVLVTDRNMSMAEVMGGGRSTDYEVSGLVMQLKKNEDGKEGRHRNPLCRGEARLRQGKQKIEIESLGAQPIRLTNIKREK